MNSRFVLILFILMIPFATSARSLKEIKASGVLQVATEGAFPPFNSMQGDVASGFEIDLVNAIAKSLGLKTQWQAKSFDGLLIGLQQDRYDLVAASHAITPEREKAVDFLPPHYCSGGQIVALKGGPKSLEQLAGKKIGAQVSSIYPKFIESHVKPSEIKTFPTDPDVILALLNHKIDSALTDRFLARQAQKSHSELQTGDIVNPERNAMAVKKGNVELRDALKAAFTSFQADGTYEKLSKKYFGEDIRCKP